MNRNTDNPQTTANDILALTWTIPPAHWGSLQGRFAEPFNNRSCTPNHTDADLACSNCILLALLKSRVNGESAFLATAREWGDVGAYLAVVMHFAQPQDVARILASFDAKTRVVVEGAIAPISWLSNALASANPFLELSQLAALDLEREVLLSRNTQRQIKLRANPFVGVGWTLRWRGEDKLVDAYRTELRLLASGKKSECSVLYALHQMSTPAPPKEIASASTAFNDIPACSALAAKFKFRNSLHEGMPSLYGNMFASPVVLQAASHAMRPREADGPTLRALREASIGLIPADFERTYNDEQEGISNAWRQEKARIRSGQSAEVADFGAPTQVSVP